MPQIFHAPQTEAPALLDEEGLIQRYEALPPRAKIVLHLKVIAGPYVEKDVLSRAASMVQIPMPDGKNLNSGIIGEIVGQAKRSGLWDQLNDPGSLVRHHINIAAFEDPQRDLYIKAIEAAERRDAYYYSGYSEAQALRKLRFAIYLNDAKATAELVAADPPRSMGQARAVLRNTGAGAGVAGKPRARHPGSGSDGEAHLLPLSRRSGGRFSDVPGPDP